MRIWKSSGVRQKGSDVNRSNQASATKIWKIWNEIRVVVGNEGIRAGPHCNAHVEGVREVVVYVDLVGACPVFVRNVYPNELRLQFI